MKPLLDALNLTLLYLISIAVKDYEVTKFLYDKGFVKDQVAYAKWVLKPSEEDMLSWEIASANPLGGYFVLLVR